VGALQPIDHFSDSIFKTALSVMAGGSFPASSTYSRDAAEVDARVKPAFLTSQKRISFHSKFKNRKSDLAARGDPEVLQKTFEASNNKRRSRKKQGWPMHPQPRVRIDKEHERSHHRFTGLPAFPAQWF